MSEEHTVIGQIMSQKWEDRTRSSEIHVYKKKYLFILFDMQC
jgi:hypothetical protein